MSRVALLQRRASMISTFLHLSRMRVYASLFVVAAVTAAAAAEQGAEQGAEQPNVVFIFIDDMGYGDIGAFGNTVNKTPCLDRMASEGLKLTQFYVSNTACAPS